jgi:hypothetical protein
VPGTNHGEVPAIQRGDLPRFEALTEGDDRRVNGPKRQIPVHADQFRDAQPVPRCDGLDDEVPHGQVPEETQLSRRAQPGRDELGNLCDDQRRDQQRSRMLREQLKAGPVIAVVGVDVGVQRSSIDDQRGDVASAARISSIRSEMSSLRSGRPRLRGTADRRSFRGAARAERRSVSDRRARPSTTGCPPAAATARRHTCRMTRPRPPEESTGRPPATSRVHRRRHRRRAAARAPDR